jgi:hypothetical protein
MALELSGSKSIFPKTNNPEIINNFTITLENGIPLIFPLGVGVDTSIAALTISGQAYGESCLTQGYKVTRKIYNTSGSNDSYDWAIVNSTKGITLDSGTITLTNYEFSVLYNTLSTVNS